MGGAVEVTAMHRPQHLGKPSTDAPVEPRTGFRARARKRFTNFIHSRSPKKEPLQVGAAPPEERVQQERGAPGQLAIASRSDSFSSGVSVEEFNDFSSSVSIDNSSYSAFRKPGEMELDPTNIGHSDAREASEAGAEAWPEEFVCPISKMLMADPVVVASGATYERENIRACWAMGVRVCLKTGEPLETEFAVKNTSLKQAIDHWCDSHRMPRPSTPDSGAALEAVRRACGVQSSALEMRVQETSSSSSSSSDSSGGGSRQGSRFGPTKPIPGMLRPPVKLPSQMPMRIPEATPVNSRPVHDAGGGVREERDSGEQPTATTAAAMDSSEQHDLQGELNGERMILAKNHTWSGANTARKYTQSGIEFSAPVNAVGRTDSDRAEAMDERTSPSSPKYMHSSSVLNNPSCVVETQQQQGRGGVPLPLTTKPFSFSELSSSLPEDGGARVSSSGDGTLVPAADAAAADRGSSTAHEDLGEEAVDSLIRKLQHRHAMEQEQAVMEIRRLTRVSARNRVILCEPHVLEALLPLLQSRYTYVQINAVASIMNVSLERDNKLKVARVGAIPPLIDVLKSGHPEAQEHAAGAIFSLALNDDNKMAIGVLGAIPPLIHVLRSGKYGARRDAAMALYHLSLSQMNRTKLIKAGAVGIFLGIAKEERGDLVSRALLILCNIAAMQDGRVALAEMSAIPVMVGLLTRGDDEGKASAQVDEGEERVNWAEVREHAAATLLQLSHSNFRFKTQAVQSGALDGLKRLAEEGTPRAKEKASALLLLLRDAPGGDGHSEENIYRRSYIRSTRATADEKSESAQF